MYIYMADIFTNLCECWNVIMTFDFLFVQAICLRNICYPCRATCQSRLQKLLGWDSSMFLKRHSKDLLFVVCIYSMYVCTVCIHAWKEFLKYFQVAKLHPDCPTYAHVYKKYGLLHSHTYMAHCCHSSAAERALMKLMGVGAVHCASSNVCSKFEQYGA